MVKAKTKDLHPCYAHGLHLHPASDIARLKNSSSVQSQQLLKYACNATLRTSTYAKTLSRLF